MEKRVGTVFHSPFILLPLCWFSRDFSVTVMSISVGKCIKCLLLLSVELEVKPMSSRIFRLYQQGCLALALIYLPVMGKFGKVALGTCIKGHFPSLLSSHGGLTSLVCSLTQGTFSAIF